MGLANAVGFFGNDRDSLGWLRVVLERASNPRRGSGGIPGQDPVILSHQPNLIRSDGAELFAICETICQ